MPGLAQGTGDADPVHPGHGDVEDGDIVGIFLSQPQGLEPVTSLIHGIAALRQCLLEVGTQFGIIFRH